MSAAFRAARDILRGGRRKIVALLAVVAVTLSILIPRLTIVFAFVFLGLPLFIVGLSYLWARLCRDPSGLPSTAGWCATTGFALRALLCRCHIDIQHTPSLLLFVFLVACLGGFILSRPIGHTNVEPPAVMAIGYNGFGALLLVSPSRSISSATLR